MLCNLRLPFKHYYPFIIEPNNKEMTNRITKIASLGVFVLSLFLCSCGTSSEEQRQQEIQDSLRLEKERRELLNRANQMFEADTLKGEDKTDAEDED